MSRRLNRAGLSLVAVTAALGLVACSSPSPAAPDHETGSEDIVGGTIAAEGQFPAAVGLLIAETTPELEYLTCTATKIGPRRFLTAAHCVNVDAQPGRGLRDAFEVGRPLGIHFGALLKPDETTGRPYVSTRTVVTIDRVHVHPSWEVEAATTEEVVDADVAVLDVSGDTPDVQIAAVDMQTQATGERVVMAGYGCRTVHHGRQTHLGFDDARITAVQATMLEISTPDTTSEKGAICPGDSGGGLYRASDAKRLTVVGVNSRFMDNTILGVPMGDGQSLFTRLDNGGMHRVADWLGAILVDTTAP